MTVGKETIINFYISRLNKSKWDVMFRTKSGIQVKKRKQFSYLGFWAGLLLMPFWGFGLIVWILAILDYAFQQEKILFVSIDQMIEKMREAK